jgi:hypothetical protein
MGGDTWGSKFLRRGGDVEINYLSSQHFMNYLNCTQSPQSNSTALLDSGCTAHFLIANDRCKNKLREKSPLEVRLPNGAIIASSHTATLDLP